jgi:hypothetical protein
MDKTTRAAVASYRLRVAFEREQERLSARLFEEQIAKPLAFVGQKSRLLAAQIDAQLAGQRNH